jgi:hypothetical protein
MKIPKSVRVALSVIAPLAVLSLGIYKQYGLSLWPRCETHALQRLEVAASSTFEFRRTACSGFGAGYRIDMVGLGRGSGTETVLFSYAPFEIELFSYDPVDLTAPPVSTIAPNRIRVSLARVDEVYKRMEKWRDLEIEYDIGRVVYPADRPKAN